MDHRDSLFLEFGFSFFLLSVPSSEEDEFPFFLERRSILGGGSLKVEDDLEVCPSKGVSIRTVVKLWKFSSECAWVMKFCGVFLEFRRVD